MLQTEETMAALLSKMM